MLNSSPVEPFSQHLEKYDKNGARGREGSFLKAFAFVSLCRADESDAKQCTARQLPGEQRATFMAMTLHMCLRSHIVGSRISGRLFT